MIFDMWGTRQIVFSCISYHVFTEKIKKCLEWKTLTQMSRLAKLFRDSRLREFEGSHKKVNRGK